MTGELIDLVQYSRSRQSGQGSKEGGAPRTPHGLAKTEEERVDEAHREGEDTTKIINKRLDTRSALLKALHVQDYGPNSTFTIATRSPRDPQHLLNLNATPKGVGRRYIAKWKKIGTAEKSRSGSN